MNSSSAFIGIIVTIFILNATPPVSGEECNNDEFACSDGTCIPKLSFCDSNINCDDGSDEYPYYPSLYTAEDGIPCTRDYPERYKYNFCLLPLNQSHKATSLCRNTSSCQENEFECSRIKRCLPRLFFCSSSPDCELDDMTDEIPYNESLHTAEDGIPCYDRYLNKICLLPKDQAYKSKYICRSGGVCLEDEYSCPNGKKCITRFRFCNSVPDCSDGSDELLYNPLIHTEEDGIPCTTSLSGINYNICLLPKNQINKAAILCRNPSDCLDHEFSCANRKTCVPMSNFCNVRDGCGDWSEEITYTLRKQHLLGGIPCHNPINDLTCLLPSRFVCDGAVHCFDHSDECNCETSELYCNGTSECPLGIDECFCVGNNTRDNSIHIDEKCFRCLDGSKIISLAQLCDGIFQCEDLSDECLCTTSQKESSKQTEIQMICEATICSGEDCKCPVLCNSSQPNSNGSQLECLSTRHICNGRSECSDKTDEKFCIKLSVTTCTDDVNTDDDSAIYCDLACRWPRGKGAKKCDSRPLCGDLEEEECSEAACGNKTMPEFCKFVKDGTFYCKDETYLFAGYEVCDGKPDCNSSVPWESEDEMFCSDQFYCKDHKPLKIPITKKCDLIKDCDDSSDELECPNESHFYCKDGGRTKFIKNGKQVCDGNEDCQSAIDECQNCTQGVFSSDEAMISTKPLIPFLWIISITAIVGNAFTISLTLRKIFQKKISNRQRTSKVEKSQNYMIFSLSIADMLVSIYTVAIVIENAMLSEEGRYCLKDQEWRSGPICSGIGAIMMIGSEASVFTLTVITTFRLRGIMKPFEKPPLAILCLVLSFAWITAILLATLPLSTSLEDYFVESKWFGTNLFVSTIEREYVEPFTKKLLVLKDENASYIAEHGSIGSWKLVEALLKELNPNLVPVRKFGYYSTHGVCLPRIFPNYNDATWAYSLIIILINFGAFIYILGGYITIFKMATKKTVRKTGNPDHDVKLQRKVTAIVITDFCCWIPVAFMGFLQISGVNISNEVYVPVGTILIPINSALNPFLYSDAPQWIWNKLQPVCKRISTRTTICCNQLIVRMRENRTTDHTSTTNDGRLELSAVETIKQTNEEQPWANTTRLYSTTEELPGTSE